MEKISSPASLNYRQVLADELKRRVLANSRYSMRGFAGTLGISPAFLSKVLRAQKNISLEKAIRICETLRFTDSETQQFCASVRSNSPCADERAPASALALPKLLDGNETHEVSILELDEFEVISEWWHYAIRELTECRDFNPHPTAIAKRLGISPEAAELAVQRMLKLGVLQKVRGRLKKAKTYVATPTIGHPNQAIRSFHRKMIEKACEALESQSIQDRDISGVTLAIHPEKIDQAKTEIRKFRRRMAKLLDTGRPTTVYQLNVQFFRLSKETP